MALGIISVVLYIIDILCYINVVASWETGVMICKNYDKRIAG